ncbi:hypothetical protein ANTRET_LOCUS5348 [Anthophora retusa]
MVPLITIDSLMCMLTQQSPKYSRTRKFQRDFCLKRRIKLVKFLRTGCQFFTKWPMDPNATKWRQVFSRILYWIHFSNELYGVLGIINGLRCCFMTWGEFAKSFVEGIFMLEVLFNLIYYRWREIEFQMENFFEVSKPKYLSHLRSMYYILTITYGIGGLLFAFVPIFAENHVIPMNTVYYMIPREKYWGICVTYAMNVVHIVNAASVVFLDLLVITIIWHATCKFSILGNMVNSLSEEELRMWIREHQNVISYVREINFVVAPLAIKSTIAVALYMIVSGLVTIYKVLFIEFSKFFVVAVFSMLRFLACSWAVDKMTEEAHGLAWDIYDSSRINTKARSEIMLIIQRCQKPITIHAVGFLTAWSLKFCGRVLYTIFTFFSTLKAVLRE